MSDEQSSKHDERDGDNVPDELEEQLDDLAETLSDPNRADRTIENQGEEGAIRRPDTRDTPDEDDSWVNEIPPRNEPDEKQPD